MRILNLLLLLLLGGQCLFAANIKKTKSGMMAILSMRVEETETFLKLRNQMFPKGFANLPEEKKQEIEGRYKQLLAMQVPNINKLLNQLAKEGYTETKIRFDDRTEWGLGEYRMLFEKTNEIEAKALQLMGS